MEERFQLFLFSLLSLLLRKYRITPFFIYHMFVRPLCIYLFNFMVYALQLTISYNANQKATFRSYIAMSSGMNIRAHTNIIALQKSLMAFWLKIRNGRKRVYWFKVSKGFKKSAKETEVRAKIVYCYFKEALLSKTGVVLITLVKDNFHRKNTLVLVRYHSLFISH